MQGEFWGNFQGKCKSHEKGKLGVCICISIWICIRIHSCERMYRLTKALNVRFDSDFRLPGRLIAMVCQVSGNDRRLCTAQWQTVKRTELPFLVAAWRSSKAYLQRFIALFHNRKKDHDLQHLATNQHTELILHIQKFNKYLDHSPLIGCFIFADPMRSWADRTHPQ